MKKNLISNFIMCFFIILALTGCDTITKIFSGDLKLKMVVENAKGLYENSQIYLIQDANEKQIGKISAVKKDENGNPILFLSIESGYKKFVREGMLFMVKRPLFSVDPPYILVDTFEKDKNNPPLKSGTIVHETSYAKYQLAVAGNTIKDVYEQFLKQSKEYMDEMEKYINSDEFDQFLKQLSQMTEDTTNFTIEQKKHFEKEILPQMERQIDSARKKYNEKLNNEMDKLKEELNSAD